LDSSLNRGRVVIRNIKLQLNISEKRLGAGEYAMNGYRKGRRHWQKSDLWAKKVGENTAGD
jgi:hypothetical protein